LLNAQDNIKITRSSKVANPYMSIASDTATYYVQIAAGQLGLGSSWDKSL
jgi:hypothetical protein